MEIKVWENLNKPERLAPANISPMNQKLEFLFSDEMITLDELAYLDSLLVKKVMSDHLYDGVHTVGTVSRLLNDIQYRVSSRKDILDAEKKKQLKNQLHTSVNNIPRGELGRELSKTITVLSTAKP